MASIGILKEHSPEKRVALLPDEVAALVRLKTEVLVEDRAGDAAWAFAEEYRKAGARIVSRNEVLAANLVIGIHPPTEGELTGLRPDQVLLALFNPFFNKTVVSKLINNKVTSLSLELIPRTTRAQSMDVLSSMGTVAGYKAVLAAASLLPRFFPMFMTAAGTIKPAKVLILGAGVAGLQAVASARKLGAVVEVFDVRKAVKEEVMSLGGKFIEVDGSTDDTSAGGYAIQQSEDYLVKQAQKIHDHAVKSDVVICTAQIPGKRAPLLLRRDTVEGMNKGSVIIDLAASTGGNCEITVNDQIILHHGVIIMGNSSLPAEMPTDASRMFGKNITNLLKLMIDKEGALVLDFKDEIIRGTCLTSGGEIMNERVKAALQL
jgi:H+-translocating NAD(P) transhydrogenase subunit alpha